MSEQQLTRTGTIVPGQRQAVPEETSSTTTSPRPAAAATSVAPVAPVALVAPVVPAVAADRWEAHSWATVVRVSCSRAALTVLASLLVWAVLPMALGWAPAVILSGSMEPQIHTGDVVVTRTVDPSTLTRGDVITTIDPDKVGKTRTHRFVQRDEDGRIVTKGDANREQDSSAVDDADVLGRGVLRVPYVGLPAYWLATGQTAALVVGLAALSGLVLAAWSPSRTGREGGSRRGGGTGGTGGTHRPTRRAPGRARARGRRERRAGVAVTALAIAAGAVVSLAPGSYAAFSAPSANPNSSFSASASFRAYAASVLADSPFLYWRLDEASGTVAADASGNNRGANLSGNIVLGRAGALLSESAATAAGLDGGTVLTAGSTASVGTAFSVELWVRTTTTTGGPLMSLTSSANNGVIERSLYLGTDGVVRFARSGAVRATGTKINDGAWHHVVYTNASTGTTNQRARLYVDGQLVGTGSAVTQTATGYWDAGQATFTGTWTGNPGASFRGDLDEIAVYTDVLDATEVTEHYRQSGR